MTKREFTIQALRAAWSKPTLAEPGGCVYKSSDGSYCIVGQVLHDMGIDDQLLIRAGNLGFADRSRKEIVELINAAEEFNLDVNVLSRAQQHFDRINEYGGTQALAFRKLLGIEANEEDEKLLGTQA